MGLAHTLFIVRHGAMPSNPNHDLVIGLSGRRHVSGVPKVRLKCSLTSSIPAYEGRFDVLPDDHVAIVLRG